MSCVHMEFLFLTWRAEISDELPGSRCAVTKTSTTIVRLHANIHKLQFQTQVSSSDVGRCWE